MASSRRRQAQLLLAIMWVTAAAIGRGQIRTSPQLSLSSTTEEVAALLVAGRYEDAEREGERRYAQPSTPSSESRQVLDLLVVALTRNGRGAEPKTRQLAETAAAANDPAPLSPGLAATRLRNLGDVLSQSGDYGRAVAQFREALRLREGSAEPRSPDLADDLEHLAQVLIDPLVANPASLDEALALVERALTVRRGMTSVTAIAGALRIRGLLWQAKGDYGKARADLEESLALQRRAHEEHPDVAMGLAQLGNQLWLAGELRQAQDLLVKGCAMMERNLRPDHPDLAICWGHLARTVEDLGDVERGRTLRERAVGVSERSLGPDHPKLAIQLNDLANNFQMQREFVGARTLYERARSIYSQRFGSESNGAAATSYNLALLAATIQDYAEARRILNRVIATWTRTFGPQHPNVGRAMSALAEVLAEEGRQTEALAYYQRAVSIRERALGPSHPLVARTLAREAVCLAQLHRSREALALSARAVAIWEQSGGQEGLAQSLTARAQVLSLSGDQPGASLAYRRALDVRLQLLGPEHPTVAETEIALASTELRLSHPGESFTLALHGERLGRAYSRLTLGALSEREALDYVASRPRGLDLALSLAEASPNRTDVYDEVIQGRGLTLDEIGGRRRFAAETGEMGALWTQLRAARQRFANLVVRGPAGGDPQRYNALVDDARREKEAAEHALAERSASFRTSQHEAAVGFTEVLQALPANTALVSFIRYTRTSIAQTSAANAAAVHTLAAVPSYVAFVLRSADSEPVLVRLGSAATLEAAIAAWREAIMTGATAPAGGLAESERTLRAVGGSLRRRIWDPVAAHLDGVTRVFVVPDAAINLVPFAALPAPAGGYLLEHGPAIHYLSTERDLAMAQPAGTPATGGLLAIGGPSFSDTTLFAALRNLRRATPVLQPAPIMAAASYRGTTSPCPTFQSMQFDALPAAGREAEDVAAVWRSFASGDSAVDTLVGGAASETMFKQRGAGHRVLHLATHGFFLSDDCATAAGGTRSVGGLATASSPAAKPAAAVVRRPATPQNPLVASGLALAGANRRSAARDDEDDGILTAEEVASMDLTGVEWTVLSACDTGLGQIQAGEGVFGLRRAFQIAGSRTVIMSLWSVEDRATRRWMQVLYRGRLEHHLDTPDAMRNAALTVLRERRAQGLSGHPFFWAGFVAAGDWR